MNNRKHPSNFCSLTYLIWGSFPEDSDDSVSTIGDLNFKAITMYMKVVTGNEKKPASCARVGAARKRCDLNVVICKMSYLEIETINKGFCSNFVKT